MRCTQQQAVSGHFNRMDRIVVAFAVCSIFAIAGFAVGGVSLSGAAAGFFAAFAVYYCMGSGAFGVMAAVFAITWIATRLGFSRKLRLGLAENRHGRNAGQVLANLGVAAVCALLASFLKAPWAVVAAMAVLSEAAADTCSSEIGEAFSDTAVLVVGFRVVPAGTNGAVTAAGTLSGIAAAALIAAVAALLQVVNWH